MGEIPHLHGGLQYLKYNMCGSGLK